MKRFAALFLAAWLVLLMGCAASRQLGQVCGAENWSSVQLFLSCADGTLCTLAVGANGRVVLTAHSEGSETASYWNTGSSALYDALLSMVN